jgi:hypothetical protein
MTPDRRTVLKSIGAVGAATTFSLGVAADELAESCVETLQTVTRSEAGFNTAQTRDTRLPVVAGGTPAIGTVWVTEPFTIEAGTFESSELSGRRAEVTITWNLGQGPSDPDFYFEQQTIAGEWQAIGYAAGESGPTGSNELSITAVDGEIYDGETFRQDVAENAEVEREIFIEGGRTYQFAVGAPTVPANIEIETKIQAFDPECVDGEGDEEA